LKKGFLQNLHIQSLQGRVVVSAKSKRSLESLNLY
jgi:hypothetical protein